MTQGSIELLGTPAWNSRSNATSVSVTHNLQSGWKRLVCIGVTIYKTSYPGTLSVAYSGAAATWPKMTAGAVWEDGGPTAMSWLYYILDDKLPSTTGNKTVTATVQNASNLGIFVVAFKNVLQQGPSDVYEEIETDGSTENIIDVTTQSDSDVCFSVGVGQDGQYGYGENQINIGRVSNGLYMTASYEINPLYPVDTQMLDIRGDSAFVSGVWQKALASVASRVFIIG